jgi:hypothetical protein
MQGVFTSANEFSIKNRLTHKNIMSRVEIMLKKYYTRLL